MSSHFSLCDPSQEMRRNSFCQTVKEEEELIVKEDNFSHYSSWYSDNSCSCSLYFRHKMNNDPA